MKKLFLLILCFIFAQTGNVCAQTGQGTDSFELGTEISSIKYEEPDVMQEKGLMYGVCGSYTYSDVLMLKIDGRFSTGSVDYKNSGTLDNVDDYMWELRILGGGDFYLSEASTLTAYTGFGLRYLNDDMSGRVTSTGAQGYKRESNYIYSPVGATISTILENGWAIGATLEYDLFWAGKQKSYLGSIPGYYDIENDQESGYGLRASIDFIHNGSDMDFIISPFVRYWDIKDSKITVDPIGRGWIEPKNNSTEVGLKVGLKF
ncbi:MAG: hypothetical protein KKF93_00370 [Candidatus Omnitrophica bacterium]|nr:hypothetical protein [Candidatus Omnitrophota bacterium]